MKTKFLYFFTIILIVSACKTSTSLQTKMYRGHEILVGKAQKSDFEKQPYNKWFSKGLQSYQPDSSIIAKLKPVIGRYNITVLMGTWCGDSQEQVPKLYKVLEASGYNSNRITLFCTPRKYKYYQPAKDYKIIRVPTIIIYKNGIEKGRIIEYPMKSIEADLLKIMTTDEYLHELNDYSE